MTMNSNTGILPVLLLVFIAVVILPLGAEAMQEDERPFVTTWRVDKAGGDITIPVGGANGTYTIFWGDGTVDADVSGDQRHTYTKSGDYTISIYGDFTRIYLDGQPNAQKLLSIDQWGDIQWESMGSAFSGAHNMIYGAADSPNLPSVTNMSRMFYSTAAFNGDLSIWDVFWMFDDSAFNGDLSTWDVSSVTDMSGMFAWSAFNGDLSTWDVSSVTDMSGMFSSADTFNGDISSWDVSSVTDMSWMFSSADTFNGDISSWDVSSVTDMRNMFERSAFNGNISSWDVSSVTDMSGMFDDSTFNGDLSTWDVSSVTSMKRMFTASAFNGNISFWDVSNVNDMSYMFTASAFNGNISSWDVSSVTSMKNMFENSLFNGNISSWDVSSVTDMGLMFTGAYLFNGNISSWDVSSVTRMAGMFHKTDSFDQNLGNWYITIDNTSIKRADVPGIVGTISAQNAYLDGHNPQYASRQNPTYTIIPGGDSDRFEITDGNKLIMVSAAPDQESYTITITATGDRVFQDGNNQKDIQIILKD